MIFCLAAVFSSAVIFPSLNKVATVESNLASLDAPSIATTRVFKLQHSCDLELHDYVELKKPSCKEMFLKSGASGSRYVCLFTKGRLSEAVHRVLLHFFVSIFCCVTISLVRYL